MCIYIWTPVYICTFMYIYIYMYYTKEGPNQDTGFTFNCYCMEPCVYVYMCICIFDTDT